MTAGELARKIKVPYTTIATWLRKGQVPGALPQNIGDFRVWMVPEEAANSFPAWRPKPGRPPLTDEEKAARAKKSAVKKAGVKEAAETSANGLPFEPPATTKPKDRAKKTGAKKTAKKKGGAAK